MAKMETLQDDFTNGIGPAWNPWDVTWSNGRVGLPISTGQYSGMESVSGYDLLDSYLFAHFPDPPAFTESTEMFLEAHLGGFNYGNAILVFRSGSATDLFLRVIRNGVNTQQAISTSHQWWRMRLTASHAHLDTSADGYAWAQQLSIPHTFTTALMADARVNIAAGAWDTTSARTAFVDNVNVLPIPATGWTIYENGVETVLTQQGVYEGGNINPAPTLPEVAP